MNLSKSLETVYFIYSNVLPLQCLVLTLLFKKHLHLIDYIFKTPFTKKHRTTNILNTDFFSRLRFRADQVQAPFCQVYGGLGMGPILLGLRRIRYGPHSVRYKFCILARCSGQSTFCGVRKFYNNTSNLKLSY